MAHGRSKYDSLQIKFQESKHNTDEPGKANSYEGKKKKTDFYWITKVSPLEISSFIKEKKKLVNYQVDHLFT